MVAQNNKLFIEKSVLTLALLGTATGAAIGLLLCFFAFFAARRHTNEASIGAYRPPEWRGFARGVAPILIFLVFLHWLPALLTWGYAFFQGQALVINERPWRAILFVGYALASTAFSTGLIGELWATWQYSRRTKIG